ncbi:hypothetical protein QAD02_021824 [Eretmocerus hayati]|uniref:Uncharacterized protein n=1 Tax=Eretmocerus hayati TaxID=131215 RepID=A0ACC2PRA0_9HYME|nr:hypothetical protein QAD02_021824 [Eretmocerus hayati]
MPGSMDLPSEQCDERLALDTNKCVLFREVLTDNQSVEQLGEHLVGYASFLDPEDQHAERIRHLIDPGAACYIGWPKDETPVTSHTRKVKKRLKDKDFEYRMVQLCEYGGWWLIFP